MLANKKIVIVVPVYNNSKTIDSVFERIPATLKSQIDEYIVVDDGSSDQSSGKINSLKQIYKNIIAITHPANRGYALAQKSGFKLALERRADIAVLLHADGQYSPEELPRLLEPLLADEADIVQGSRILGGKALHGGMPLYKYIAIRFASIFENLIYGMRLREYHSGYMLYSRRALEMIPFERLSDTMYFDAEMLFVGHSKGLRIKSLPISTCYSKDIKSGVKPIRYVFEVISVMLKKLFGRYKF